MPEYPIRPRPEPQPPYNPYEAPRPIVPIPGRPRPWLG